MEDIDGGLHPAVDGQSLDENEDKVLFDCETPPLPPKKRRKKCMHISCVDLCVHVFMNPMQS